MKPWTTEHQALLNALQAASIVPTLYRRLSLERYMPDAQEVRRLRDWATSIRADPGWALLAPVLERPAAWPEVWQAGCDHGFSPQTDHHNALLLGSFCERFLQARDYEGAAWTWHQSLASWSRVYRSGYPAELFDAVAPKLSEDAEAQRAELLRTMLDGIVSARVANLREAAGLAAPSEVPPIQRRLLRFAIRSLEDVLALTLENDTFGTLQQLRRLAGEGIGQVNGEVLRRFETIGKGADLSEASGDAILGRFRWVATYFEIAGMTEGAVTSLVGAATETCWTLRKLGRDDLPEFGEILDVVAPFNENLAERLRSFDSAFGHNGQCADFLVFQAEREKDSPKKLAILHRGLEICPGHRNSAMLAAWEQVREAQRILTQTALTPPLISMIGGPPARVEQALRRAWSLCDEAEALYAFHESLPELREQLRAEAKRLRVSLPE